MNVVISRILLAAGCCLAAAPAAGDEFPPVRSAVEPHGENRVGSGEEPTSVHARRRERIRRAAELRREARRRLQAEARTEGHENLSAIEDLVDIYVALRLDRSLTEAERQRLAGKVRSRLIRVREHLTDGRLQSSAAVAPPEDHDAASTGKLAERFGRQATKVSGLISRQVLAQQGLAGPAAAIAGGAVGPAGQPADDYGQDLADLIQTVIAPSTWARSGGPGSIYYYRPLRVLVIRQTGEVHGKIGNVIEDLRQAGN